MRYLIIFDDSHGIETKGKATPLFLDGTYMKEHDFSYDVVEKANDLLKKYENIDVFFTAPEKRDISLDERVQRANDIYEDGKNIYDKIILISVHANALNGIWGPQNGTATFHYPSNMTDKAFAETIQRNLIKKTKLNSHRGGVVEGNFQIIREVKMTACLCECAFMDNSEEAKLLMSDEFRQACAEGITAGILEYFGMGEEMEIKYNLYKDGTHELSGNPGQLTAKIVNQKNTTIKEKNCTNGSFFWYEDLAKLKSYPTSILIIDGKIFRNEANHYYDFAAPQSVFIVYKNGKVEMKRIIFANDLDVKNIKFAVGGVGLRNTTDKDFKYSPIIEGFRKGYRLKDNKLVDYSDVLRIANKTVIGYNIKHNKIYLLARKNISHGALIKLISDNSADAEYNIALSLDGGGSTFMNNNNGPVLKGDGRVINNIIGFGL